MTQNKAILVATIGTRDLAFQLQPENEWVNIGNAFTDDIETISQQVKVQYDLAIDKGHFRTLTKHIYDNLEEYKDRIIPIIIGKLIEDNFQNIKTIYLVATDQFEQNVELKYYQRDTIYAAKIIQKYLEDKYKLTVKLLSQGNKDNENPSNFEQMFVWWEREFWGGIASGINKQTDLWLCLKGGVNQSSEAARISAIIKFENQAIFYDFVENKEENLLGKPSPYTAPFKGINYLWNRKQTEALSLLERYDYEAVNAILKPYYQDTNNQNIRKLELWLDKAIKWNNADFDTFVRGLKQIPNSNWWWKGYESAYLGLVRLKQGNNIEAFFHTFRGIEGLMSELIINKYNSHISINQNDLYDTPRLKLTVCQDQKHPEFKNNEHLFRNQEIRLYGSLLGDLVKIALPTIKDDERWTQFFNYTQRERRNPIYHRLIKLPQDDLFEAWLVNNQQEWEDKILYLLNSLSKQNYSSLEKASLMAEYHRKIKELIEKYYPLQSYLATDNENDLKT
jgi:hypothetical protein